MSHSLRIAYVLPGFCADEDDPCIPVITTFVREMAEYADVSVFTAEYPYRPGTYRVHNTSVHCTGTMPRNRLEKILAWQRAIDRIEEEHRRQPFDLVHGFWGTTPGYAAVRGAKKIRRPCVVSLAGGEFADFQDKEYGAQRYRRSRWILARSLENATVLTAGSEWFAQKVPAGYRDKLRTIPLGIDTSYFSPGAMRTGHLLLAVGAMIPIKDYPTMLAAVALAQHTVPDLTLSIAGWNQNPDERRRVEQLLIDLRLEDSVTILGERNHAQMPALYRSHDLLLHSSRYEAQGMAIIEALSTGMPVVSTDVGIVSSLPENLVYRVPAGDWKGMGDMIVGSLQEDRHAKQAHHAAPRLLRKEFDAVIVGERFRKLYEEIASPPHTFNR